MNTNIIQIPIGTLTIQSTFVTPEMFGAKGDGVADDTDAVAKALTTGKHVLLHGVYAVRGGITSTAKRVIGDDAKLIALADATIVVEFSGLNELSGVTLDCNNKNICYGFKITKSNPTIKNVVVCNIRKTNVNTKASVCGMYISGGKVTIDGYTAKDLYAVGNRAVSDAFGSVNGVIVSGYEDLVAKNLTFEEIHSINSTGDVVFEDAAGLYIANSSSKTANAVVSCVKGKNFGKRLIKSQTYYVSIDNVFAINEMGDNLSFIGILPPGGDTTGLKRASAMISNCTLIDTYEEAKALDGSTVRRVVAITGDVAVSNCKFITTNCFCASVEQGGNASFSQCEFGAYGILHHGNNLDVLGCAFKSKIGIHSNITPTGKTIIANTKMNWLDGDKSFSYVYNTFKGVYFITNSIIEAGSSVSNIHIYDFAKLSNVVFTVENQNRTKVSDIVYVEHTANVIMDNIYIDASKMTDVLSIRYFSNYGKLLIDGMEERNNTTLYFVKNNGTLTLKNTPIERIYSTDGNLIVDQPPYVDSLPSKSRYPDGISVRLKTDDRLYTKTNGKWVVV